MAKLSHREVEFVGAGIDRLNVRGDSWFYPDDRRVIFHESNPGPHREFEEKWVLEDDRYVLAEHKVLPSAYNALVEFIYALSVGDGPGAAALVADPALLGKARELGLVQSPLGREWLTNLDRYTVCCGPIYIIEGPPQQVVVEFVQQGDEWLISDMRPERYPYP